MKKYEEIAMLARAVRDGKNVLNILGASAKLFRDNAEQLDKVFESVLNSVLIERWAEFAGVEANTVSRADCTAAYLLALQTCSLEHQEGLGTFNFNDASALMRWYRGGNDLNELPQLVAFLTDELWFTPQFRADNSVVVIRELYGFLSEWKVDTNRLFKQCWCTVDDGWGYLSPVNGETMDSILSKVWRPLTEACASFDAARAVKWLYTEAIRETGPGCSKEHAQREFLEAFRDHELFKDCQNGGLEFLHDLVMEVLEDTIDSSLWMESNVKALVQSGAIALEEAKNSALAHIKRNPGIMDPEENDYYEYEGIRNVARLD